MKCNLRLIVFAALAVFVISDTAAQGNFEGGRKDHGGFGRGGFGHRGPRMRNQMAEIEQKLKEKYPEDWAEIQKLRDEADKKLKELARKANIELPAPPKSMEERMAELKQKYPQEFAEYEELAKTDRFAAFGKLRELMMRNHSEQNSETAAPPPPEVKRENFGRKIADLQRKYPEEWKKIQEVRKTDPEKSRRMTLELLKKMETESVK